MLHNDVHPYGSVKLKESFLFDVHTETELLYLKLKRKKTEELNIR